MRNYHSEPYTYEKSLADTCHTKDCLVAHIKIHPNNAEAHAALGNIYLSEQDYTGAIKEYDITLNEDSAYNAGYVYRDRATCKNNTKDFKGAIEDMNRAIRLNPGERYFHWERGLYHYNIQQMDSATADFTRALQIWSKFDYARSWRARLYCESGKYRESLDDYSLLEANGDFLNEPYNDENHYFRGIAKFKLNGDTSACSDWRSIPQSQQSKDALEKYCR